MLGEAISPPFVAFLPLLLAFAGDGDAIIRGFDLYILPAHAGEIRSHADRVVPFAHFHTGRPESGYLRRSTRRTGFLRSPSPVAPERREEPATEKRFGETIHL